jgi:hypothetical protein
LGVAIEADAAAERDCRDPHPNPLPQAGEGAVRFRATDNKYRNFRRPALVSVASMELADASMELAEASMDPGGASMTVVTSIDAPIKCIDQPLRINVRPSRFIDGPLRLIDGPPRFIDAPDSCTHGGVEVHARITQVHQ